MCAVKGMKRAEIAFTLETFGADAATARSAAEEQVRSQSPPPAAASSNDLSERLRLGVSSLSTFGTALTAGEMVAWREFAQNTGGGQD